MTTPPDSFETDFWIPYDKKVGKDKCITKYYLLSPEDHLKIKVHVPGFVSRKRNKQFRPNPLSYLNGKMWLDESVGEEKQVYREIPAKSVSTYQPEPFDRSEFIKSLREKLKANFEHGKPLEDYGGVITVLLIEKCQMLIPGSIKERIVEEVEHEATRERNRFEERYSGHMESDIRDSKLNWFLDRCRKEKRKIYLEI